jgi:hypothetical protein
MKNLKKMKKMFFLLVLVCCFSLSVFAQLNLPRESQKQTVSQVIGDTTVTVVYHRPNIKTRKVWGELVPYGKVWRTGANENTTFEVSRDVTINGQTLPAGKYGLHSIPNQNEWIVIFSKDNDDWGSFTYDEKKDALRVTVKPQTTDFHETMSLEFENIRPNSSDVAIVWEKVKVPFTIDVGDVNARTMVEIRKQMANLKADDFQTPRTAANWIMTMKMTENYKEALAWLDAGIKNRETYGLLFSKARLLAETGNKAEAIATGEKAIAVGKAATPAANTADLEKLLAEWKTKK